MPITFLFTAAAVFAFLPTAILLFAVLDRYAAPKVPKSLFDERKVFLTFAVGIPLGIVLALIFLAYAQSLSPTTGGDVGAASLYFLLFILVAALLRRVLVRTKTFGGIQGGDPQLAVHTFSYGAVSGATVGLGLSLEQLDVFFPGGHVPPPQFFLLLLAFSTDLLLLEAWAGLRFGRAMRKGFSWLPPWSVLIGEALGLLALSPIFAGLPQVGDVTLGVLFVAACYAIYREEPRALRPLRKAAGLLLEGSAGKFGRGAQGPSREKGSEDASVDTAPDAPPAEAGTDAEQNA